MKDFLIETEGYISENNLLSNLSRVNVFVGVNNTGKSRFLRSIFYPGTENKLIFFPHDIKFSEFLDCIENFKSDEIKSLMRYRTDERKKVYNSMFNLINVPQYLIESENPFDDWKSFFDKNHSKIRDFEINFENLRKEFFNDFDLNDENLFKYEFYKVYIPSLRGLLPLIPEENINAGGNEYTIFDFIDEDLFAHRIKEDYFRRSSKIIEDINDSYPQTDKIRNFIVTGHYFYKYVQEFLLGDLRQRENIKEYQEYLSENFFQGQEVTLIPKLDDDVLTVKIGEEKEQKIYNLGEGIQSIILITLPLFLFLNKSEEPNTNILVFIEEPEIGLHPSLQRKLMETFLDDRFENFQFFFTTHSNHFIDNVFKDRDVSIYSFDKDIDEKSETIVNIENVSFNHFPTLEKLGALPSAVLMSNCVILVEGSWDIEHYKFYLDLYQKHLEACSSELSWFNEGIHYSFLRGGGSEADKTLKDWNIKNRLFYVVDADDDADKLKKERKFEELNFTNFHIINVREVENLISKEALIEILNDIKEFNNLTIDEDFDLEKYKHSKFYEFIGDEILSCDDIKDHIKKKDLKKLLAQKEPKFINDYDDLTVEAKDVIEEIYEFIERNNPTK